MNIGEILDTFGKFLGKDDILKLEAKTLTGGAIPDFTMGSAMTYGIDEDQSFLGRMFESQEASYGASSNQGILVQHVEWKSQKKIGFLTVSREDAEAEESMVSEDFPVPSYAITDVVTKEFGEKCTYYF